MILSRTWLICRVCMKQVDGMVNLFTQIADRPLWNLLRDCGGIPVRKNDNLPDKICEHCIERLWKVHAFRLDCQRAHREITQVVQPKLTDEDEFLTEPGSDKFSLLDKYHTQIIDRFEAQKCNGYIGSNGSSIDSFSMMQDDDPAIKCRQRKARNSVEQEFIAIDKNREDEKQNNLVRPKEKRKQRITSSSSSFDAAKAVTTKLKRTKHTRRASTKRKVSRLDNKEHSKTTYLCNVCENVYSSAELLRHHMYIHRKPHTCKICGKMFSQKQQKTNHVNSHSGIQPYPCRMCTRTFADTSNRNKHERTVHKRKSFRKYPKSRECAICHKTFETLSSLREHHLKTHLKSLATTPN